MKTMLLTGGAGFIGGCFVRRQIASGDCRIINLDKLTYAGNTDSLPSSDKHIFVEGDICDRNLITQLLSEYQPTSIVHFAAESHVDRSIDGPLPFVETNVMGTVQLLDAARSFYDSLTPENREQFRFLHVSTDEVYGSLGPTGAFSETTPYSPNSPYSASKAASDHFVNAWHHTFGLPTLMTNCSNNYGPYQFPEKLIPLVTLNAIEGTPLPVYGDGSNVRDWLHVEDHCQAIEQVLAKGRVGQCYNIGGASERSNLEVVHAICDAVDQLCPNLNHRPCRNLIQFVKDRPGHDQRYAIDATKISSELNWQPTHTFENGIIETVQWYLNHADWVHRIQSGEYKRQRLGLNKPATNQIGANHGSFEQGNPQQETD
ncbi:MAG: dTDP-glucose 4,6-dehydratase [Fuerstiella sp.]